MYFFIDPMSFPAFGANHFAAASPSYTAIEMASPVSRSRSKNADRAPGWVEIACSAASLYSLMALSSSDFLYLDLTTPAFISHLRENHVLRGDRVSNRGDHLIRRAPHACGYRGIVRSALRARSRHSNRVGNQT